AHDRGTSGPRGRGRPSGSRHGGDPRKGHVVAGARDRLRAGPRGPPMTRPRLASGLLILTVVAVVAGIAVTRPAHGCIGDPAPRLVHLPDGRTAMIVRRGDEYFNWDEDENGYAVTRFPDGMYVYAQFDQNGQLVPVGAPVGLVDPATLGLHPHA